MTDVDLTTPYGQLPNMRHGGPGSGRKKNCGLSIIECLNQFADPPLTEKQLRAICADKAETWVRRAAAKQAIQAMEDGDMADFDSVIRGGSLVDVRDSGIDTRIVRSIKPGQFGVSVELHDRAEKAMDFILNRTHGKPAQEIQLDVSGVPPLIMVVSPRTRQTSTNSQLGENSAYTEALGATDET